MTIAQFRSKWRPWVTTAAEEIVRRFPGTQNQGTYPNHHPSEALAVDFMVPVQQFGLGHRIAQWLANPKIARALGIWYVIWWGRIWSMTRPEEGWLPYFDRNAVNPNGTPNLSRRHHNHVHVSFYDRRPPGLSTAPAKPATTYTLYTTRTVRGYYGPGSPKQGQVRFTRPKGRKLTGVIVKINDGRYLRTPKRTYYPMSTSGKANFRHASGKLAGK